MDVLLQVLVRHRFRRGYKVRNLYVGQGARDDLPLRPEELATGKTEAGIGKSLAQCANSQKTLSRSRY